MHEYTTMHLLTQYYTSDNLCRRKELYTCLQSNLANPHIDAIYNFIEKGSDIPNDIKEHPKHNAIYLKTKKRITFKDFFLFIKKKFTKNTIVCICNNDIIIDKRKNSKWGTIKESFFKANKHPKVLNLSRIEILKGNRKRPNGHFSSYSSDAWVLKTPLLFIPDTRFGIGTLYSDWAIAGRFDKAGYHVYNWAQVYQIYHLDLCLAREGRHPTKKKHIESNSPESARKRLFICPFLDYNFYLSNGIKPQEAKCDKKCKHGIHKEIKQK